MVDSDSGWFCGTCTYYNSDDVLMCDMCGTACSKEVPKDRPIWEWFAEEEWKPYDLSTCSQIEIEYKKKSKAVQLTQGFFCQPSWICNPFQEIWRNRLCPCRPNQ